MNAEDIKQARRALYSAESRLGDTHDLDLPDELDAAIDAALAELTDAKGVADHYAEGSGQ